MERMPRSEICWIDLRRFAVMWDSQESFIFFINWNSCKRKNNHMVLLTIVSFSLCITE